jgi:hypothetical protein
MIGEAEDGVCLGYAGGLPLHNQSCIQFCEFLKIFAWDCGIDGEGAVL